MESIDRGVSHPIQSIAIPKLYIYIGNSEHEFNYCDFLIIVVSLITVTLAENHFAHSKWIQNHSIT